MKKIAIVTTDTMGPIKNGGVGTAFFFLAVTLAKNHEVTVIFVPTEEEFLIEIQKWVDFYKKLNVKLKTLSASLAIRGTPAARRSYQVYVELKNSEFEIIHFPELNGIGYYSLLGARVNPKLQKAQIYVHAHGPTLWHRTGSDLTLLNHEDLEINFLEQESIRWAKSVICPSEYMKNWLIAKGWKQSLDLLVIPHAPPVTAQFGFFDGDAASTQTISEIVFIGRLENRKGIVEFLQSLKFVPENIPITLIGTTSTINGVPSLDYIQSQTRNTNRKITLITTYNFIEVATYMKTKACALYVIPSHIENLPMIVMENLYLKRRFIWSRCGGTEELLAIQHRNSGLSTITAQSIATEINRHLGMAQFVPYDLSPHILCSEETWEKLHVTKKQDVSEFKFSDVAIAICIATRNRPLLLKEALESLVSQTHKNFDVMIVNDGSDNQFNDHYEALIVRFKDVLQLKYFHLQHQGPSRARNFAAQVAQSPFLLFMDDDNLLKTNSLVEFITAQNQSQADIVTCALDLFTESLSDQAEPLSRWVPLGACLDLAPIKNVFGDTNMLIKRDVFTALGGFKDFEIGEDWELIWRAVRNNYSYFLHVDALVFYRQHTTNRSLYHNKSQKIPALVKNFFETENFPYKNLLTSYLACEFLNQKTESVHNHLKNTTYELNLLRPSSVVYIQDLFLDSLEGLFTFQINGIDPVIIISTTQVSFQPQGLQIHIFATHSSKLKVYYQTPDNPVFDESQCLTIGLKTGWNQKNIFIPSEKLIGQMRIDFGTESHQYVFEKFSLIVSRMEIAQKEFYYDSRHLQEGDVVSSKYVWLKNLNLDIYNAQDIKLDGDIVLFDAINEDPNIVFINLNQKDSLHFYDWYIEIEIATQSRMEWFFKFQNDNHFAQDRSISIPTKMGMNRIQFRIFSAIPIKNWRLDPGETDGPYKLKRIGYHNNFTEEGFRGS